MDVLIGRLSSNLLTDPVFLALIDRIDQDEDPLSVFTTLIALPPANLQPVPAERSTHIRRKIDEALRPTALFEDKYRALHALMVLRQDSARFYEDLGKLLEADIGAGAMEYVLRLSMQSPSYYPQDSLAGGLKLSQSIKVAAKLAAIHALASHLADSQAKTALETLAGDSDKRVQALAKKVLTPR